MGSLEYIQQYRSNSTKISLNSRIISFLRVIYPDEKITTTNLGQYADRYFSENRDYKKDIEKFFIAINQTPPLSQKNCLNNIKTMLEENEHELPALFWKRLRKRITGNSPLTQDEIPTNLELRKLLMNMPIAGRALFITLASSDMRIGEALSLKDSDIDLNSSPAKIKIPALITKTKTARFTFITEEAKGFIEEYKKVRTDNSRLFSFSIKEAENMWFKACRQSEMAQTDSTTGHLIYHPHGLRKYFRTVGGKLNRDAAEVLMGHKGNPNDPNYRRLDEESLVEFYLKLEPDITVFSDKVEIDRIKTNLSIENQELKARIQKLEDGLNRIYAVINV